MNAANKSSRDGAASLARRGFSSLVILIIVIAITGCSQSDDGKKSAPAEKAEAEAKFGITLDAATQARLGLKIESPVARQWSPEIKGFGRVLVPATLAAAVADLESARATAEVSRNEYARQKTLAAQNNASIRTLEIAKADATRDELAAKTAVAKFKLDWGAALLESSDREQTISSILNGNENLVQLDLPAGEMVSSPPISARILALGNENNFVSGKLIGALDGVNPQTQSQSFLFLTPPKSLAVGAAVTGFLKTSGDSINGVVVSASAILRHEGVGWVYVQTETNQFVRTEIPLDRPTADGWFVSNNLSATNKIVVVGAQAVLSAELSGGGFNTGERD